MAKVITIACKGAGLLPLSQFVEFQGELKTLSEKDFGRLKREILERGFSYTPHVWFDPNQKSKNCYLLDGHQRVRVIKHLVEKEGYECRDLPYSEVFAKSYKEAKQKLLAAASQYGRIQKSALESYLESAELTPEEMIDRYYFPEVDLQAYIAQTLQASTPVYTAPAPVYQPQPAAPAQVVVPFLEMDQLKAHPRNFRKYPEDQVQHVVSQIKETGCVPDLIVTTDNTILRGHLTYHAALALGMSNLPIQRVDCESSDTKALKILVNDNELDHLAEKDDRALSELLKEIKEKDPNGLAGTGYDEKMLANLLFVTRPASEVKTMDEAAHWVGLPEYEPQEKPAQAVVSFKSEADREEFVKFLQIENVKKLQTSWCFWWPDREREDPVSLRFDDATA